MMRVAVLALAVLLMAGCAGRPDLSALDDNDLPRYVELRETPFFPQEELWCGPAALATMLVASGVETNQDQVARQVYTPGREGTLAQDMISGARRNDRLPVPVPDFDSILVEVAEGRPVLVFQNLGLSWAPYWHYAVVIGYDLDEGTMILRSGTDRRRLTDMGTFTQTWDRAERWAYTITRPDDLPTRAEPEQVLQAVVDLESTGRLRAALAGYRATLARWPDTLVASMGVGNTLYSLGEVEPAVEAFLDAAARHPEAAEPRHNLAIALLAAGRRDEARAEAEAALERSNSADLRRSLEDALGERL